MGRNPFEDLEDTNENGDLVWDDGSTAQGAEFGDVELTGDILDDTRGSRKLHTEKRYEERCDKCNGRGRFISWGGRDLGVCRKCKGHGILSFAQPKEKRMQQRKQRQEREAKKLANAKASFMEKHGELLQWMTDNAHWNDFAHDLLDRYRAKGELTDNQLAAIYRTMEKCVARNAERQQRQEANAIESEGLTSLLKGFADAKANGLKRPSLRIGDLKFTVAPDTGRNAGHLYVKEGDQYLGKVTPEGKFLPVREATEAHREAVAAIGANPLAEAQMHGKETGQCSCCGRELTNPESIELGIGPICRDKWGW